VNPASAATPQLQNTKKKSADRPHCWGSLRGRSRSNFMLLGDALGGSDRWRSQSAIDSVDRW